MIRFSRWKYGWRSLGGDLSGGVIAALIAIPYGLAMASLMGLPPALGLFTSVVTAPVTALLGRNPVLIGGPASATVPFIALAVADQGVGGAAKVTIVAAIFLLVFCVLRLGRHLAKVPLAVVSGFSCGTGAMMIASQLPTLTGILSPVNAASTNVLVTLAQVFQHIELMRFAPLLIGAMVVIGAFAAGRLIPRAPAPLIGVVFAVAAARLFGLDEREIGSLPLEIPPFAGFLWRPADVTGVLPAAMALAVITAINLLITARVVDHFRGHRRSKGVDGDMELGAYGIANLCAGMFGAPLSVGIPARSIANVRCGGVSRVSILVHAAAIVAFLTLGNGLVGRIPIPALAGVIVYIGACLLDWSTWRRLPKMRRVDVAAFVVTAVTVVAWNAAAAVALGCVIYGVRAIRSKWFSPIPVADRAEA